MACLAGTVDAPRRWVRFVAGEPVELEGRHCTRQQPFTNRQQCSSCPAYRGIRYDGSQATGITPSGDPIGLSVDEHKRWEAAQEAQFIDDDTGPIVMWQERMAGGMGDRALRFIGDPDASDRWASYMRDYRARMTDDQLDRQRAATRERVRRHRARNVSTALARGKDGK